MKNRIAFLTLGCKLNYAETSTYERKFAQRGLNIVPWEEKADIYIINTCTVTEHSDKKCRNIIRRMHRIAPEASIVVAGCYAELKKEEIKDIEGVKFVFGAKEKSSLVPKVMEYLEANSDNVYSCSEYFPAYSSGERTRSFLKVQDGCDYHCTFCTIPFARGESRNNPIKEIISQATEIGNKGIKEIVLTGVNTGDFGKSTKESFFDLIKELNKIETIERYRISSIEPNLLKNDIIEWIAENPKFLPHFHIPLQSGSNAVLKSMGRRYNTELFMEKINYIREKIGENVFFGIDVIVGFPGETEEEFEKCYNLLKNDIRPAFIHIFPYSRRLGTPAATKKDQVPEHIKKERVKILGHLSDELHSNFINKALGTTSKVLFESSNKDGMMQGYTENYIRVQRPFNPDWISKIVEIVIEKNDIVENNYED